MGCDLEVSSIFPSSHTLCPTSPSLQWVAWVSLPHIPRYYARLRLPLALLDVLRSRSVTDTLFVPSVRVLSSSSLPLRNFCANAWPAWSIPVRLFPGGLQGNIWFSQACPELVEGFPGYPLELMPCSSTPVVTSALAISHSGLLPSTSMTASAFPPLFRRLSLVIFFPPVHDYTNFGAQLHGLFSCSPRLQTSVTGLTCEVCYCPVGYTLGR